MFLWGSLCNQLRGHTMADVEKGGTMIEKKSKGQLIAEEFDRKCKERGLAPIPTVVPERPRIWITIHPIKNQESDTKDPSKSNKSIDKEDQ